MDFSISPTTAFVEANHLCFRYPRQTSPALDAATFTLSHGSTTALCGTNGSGKSTLLLLLAGLLTPTAGTLRFPTHDERSGNAQKASPRSSPIALVPQDPDLALFGATVAEDSMLGIASTDTQRRAYARLLLDEMGLGTLQNAPVQTLSFGQKKKLTLVTALVRLPQHGEGLLLLDEPFAGLDYPGCLSLLQHLKKIEQQGITQVIVTHDLDLVENFCMHYMIMHAGTLIEHGPCSTTFPQMRAHGIRPPCSWVHKNPHLV